MTYEERNNILQSSEFMSQIRIALCDWLEYWTINGIDSIEDGSLRIRTDVFIHNVLNNIDTDIYLHRLATLVIGTDIVKEAEEVTDDVVKRALDNVLSNALSFLI